jgi:hypothetical protein
MKICNTDKWQSIHPTNQQRRQSIRSKPNQPTTMAKHLYEENSNQQRWWQSIRQQWQNIHQRREGRQSIRQLMTNATWTM